MIEYDLQQKSKCIPHEHISTCENYMHRELDWQTQAPKADVLLSMSARRGRFHQIMLKPLALRYARAVCPFAHNMLTTVKGLVRFMMNFNLSCNQIWLRHWHLSHATLLSLPSLSATLHRWQSSLRLSSLLLFLARLL